MRMVICLGGGGIALTENGGGTDLRVVGNISGAYKNTVAKDPVIPNLPIMLRVIISGLRSTPDAEIHQLCNNI